MDDVFETLEKIADRYPASIAIASHAGHTTYEHLVGNISSAASAAARNGIEAGQLVVLTGANPDVQFALALALMRLGCRVGYNRDPALYEANGVAIDVLIADAPMAGAAHRVVAVGRDWFTGPEGRQLDLPPPAKEYSTIFSSSGSTGAPKLIEYERDALLRRVSLCVSDSDVGDRPRLLSAMGNRTAAHFATCLAFALYGGMLIGTASRDAETVLNTIQLFRPDFIIMAPSTLVEILRCLDDKPRAIDKARLLRTSGSRCAPELQREALEKITEEFISFYGSTETGCIAWGYSKDVLKIDGCVGRLVEDVEALVLGLDGRMLPSGSEGEIRVKNPDGLVGRYIGDRAGEQDAFDDGWFVTGDIGLVDKDRNLIIRGRASTVINVGGSKVSPELMEEEIRLLAQVFDVGVTGIDRPEGFERICAAIVSDTNLTVDDINAHLRARNARWPVQMVKLVAAIPKTESGKIDRAALKRLCSEL